MDLCCDRARRLQKVHPPRFYQGQGHPLGKLTSVPDIEYLDVPIRTPEEFAFWMAGLQQAYLINGMRPLKKPVKLILGNQSVPCLSPQGDEKTGVYFELEKLGITLGGLKHYLFTKEGLKLFDRFGRYLRLQLPELSGDLDLILPGAAGVLALVAQIPEQVAEAPAGDVDGSNDEFTLSREPVAVSSTDASPVLLFFDGKLQIPEVDFTRDGLTLTTTTPPTMGWSKWVVYPSLPV